MMFQKLSFNVGFIKHYVKQSVLLFGCMLCAPVFALSNVTTPIPVVSQISGPTAGTYNSHNQLIFTVEFSEEVTPVFPEQGHAFLELQLESGIAYAKYLAHNGNKITFQYSPSYTDYDFDGVSVIGFYQLNFTENEIFTSMALTEKVEFPDVFIEHSNIALLPQGGLYLAEDKLEFLLKWGRIGQITIAGKLPKMSINIGVNQYLLTASIGQPGELIFTHDITELDYQAGDVSIDELFFDDSVLLGHTEIDNDNSGSHDLVVTNSNFTFQDGSSSEFIIGLSDAPEALEIERPIGEYQTGEVIEYVVQYSGNVNVVGEPELILMINGVEVIAQYSSGSGTNTLVFSYVLTSDINNVGDIEIVQLYANNATFTSDNNTTVAVNIDNIISPSAQTAIVSLSSDSENYLNEKFTVLIQSSNDNFTIDISNVSVINGEIDDFQIIDNDYQVTISPTSDGEVTVSLIDLAALGVDDNEFLITRIYDSQSPQIVSSIPESQNLIVDSKLTQLTLTFNEDVILHESMDEEIQLTVTTANLVNEPVNISNIIIDGSAINIVMNQVMIPGGHYSLAVPNSMVTDLAGNLFTDNNGNDYLLSYTTQNLAPTINNDHYVLNEDHSILLDILSNDSDPENYLDMSSVAIITAPEYGNVTITDDGALLYIPHPNVATSDILSYRVSDEQGLHSEKSVVNIDILPVNDFPVLQTDLLPKYLLKDQMFSIDLAPTDVDSETVTITLLSAPEWLHLVGNVLSGTPPDSGLAEVALALNDESLTNEIDIDFQVLTGQSDSVGLAAQWSQPAALLNQNIDLNLTLHKLIDTVDSQQYQVDIVLSDNSLMSAMSKNCQILASNTLTCAIHTEDISTESTTITLLPLSVGEIVTHVSVKYDQNSVIAQQFDLNINANFNDSSDSNFTIEENTGAIVAEVNGDSVGPEILVFGDKGLPVKIIDVLSGETLSYINNQGNTVALVQADFNTDSLNDILVVNSDTKVSALYLNKGNGIFDVASAEFAMADGAIVADLNNDANTDIIFYKDNIITTWLNSGAGQFELSQTETFDFVVDNIALADLDNDDVSDLVVQTDHQLKVVFSSGVQQGEESSVSQIEYEFDNKIISFAFVSGNSETPAHILALTNVTTQQPHAAHLLTFNADDKTLSKVDSFSEAEPKNMTLIDVNRDNLADLILTNQNGNTQIYLNQPTSSKTYTATAEVIVGQFKQVFVADTNNDQIQDLISIDTQKNIQVFQAKQDANFTVYKPVDLSVDLLSNEFEIAEFSDSQEVKITLENLSENDATGMFLQFSLHDGITLTSDELQCMTNANELICYLDTLASNNKSQLSLNLVTTNNLNLEDIQVTVGSNSIDSNIENNSQTISLSAKSNATTAETTVNEQSKSSGTTNGTFIAMLLLMFYWRRLILSRK